MTEIHARPKSAGGGCGFLPVVMGDVVCALVEAILTHTQFYMYVCTFVSVCVCVCV